jgi:hypothetical protein
MKNVGILSIITISLILLSVGNVLTDEDLGGNSIFWVEEPRYVDGIITETMPAPALADLDADGDLDLIIADQSFGYLKGFRNTGGRCSPIWTADESLVDNIGPFPPRSGWASWGWPALGDLDNDSDVDLILDYQFGYLGFRNNGNETVPKWSLDNSLIAGAESPWSFETPTLGDLDGDGDLDLLKMTGNGVTSGYRNIGDPFSPLWARDDTLVSGIPAYPLEMGQTLDPNLYDLDFDGDLDLILNLAVGGIHGFRNKGNLTSPLWVEDENLVLNLSFPSDGYATQLAIGDLNDDGKPDIIGLSQGLSFVGYRYDADVASLSISLTTIGLTGNIGENGWYRSDVEVNFTVTDACSGLGVAVTEYSFDGENWITYNEPFTLSTEGVTTVYYRSTDDAGNVEETMTETIKIDKTAPIISVTTPTHYGLYSISTTLEFSANDSISDLASIVGELTNTLGDTQQADSGDMVDLGVYTLKVTAEDNAGNAAQKEVFFEVYETVGGHATGGGYFFPDEDSTLPGGRADFGFNAKYRDGTAEGVLDFQYKDANFDFKSKSYDWLVVKSMSASFQGTGTLGDEGPYTFKVEVKDKDKIGGVDSFEIKIWEGIDTKSEPMHIAMNTLEGGNIDVHKK